MSHYAKMSIVAQQKFEAELVASMKEQFGEEGVEVCEEKKALNDWRGTKTNLKANLIVRKESLVKKLGHYAAGNDLGYERNSQGTYDVHYDASTCPVDTMNLIAQSYADKVARKQLKLKGFSVKGETLQNGEIRLVAQKFA